jgi:hypothetical protein
VRRDVDGLLLRDRAVISPIAAAVLLLGRSGSDTKLTG